MREHNSKDVLHLISQQVPHGRRSLLDVGAAHGWFVEMASARFAAVGIEPDHAMCRKTQARGVPLIEGYFPQALAGDDRFDVIVFNDVFEHISDVGQTLEECKKHLTDGGLLVLNLPSSDGVFYTASKLLKRVGFAGAFERPWQKGLPSPHVHYFNSKNLIRLAHQHGFDFVCVADLPSIRFDGLYDRISYVGGTGRLRRLLTFCAVVMLLPFIKRFDSDIEIVIVRKRDGAGPL